MKGNLLARRSAFQIHCANALHEAGIIQTVFFERGSSLPPPRVPAARLAAKALRRLGEMAAHPVRAARLARAKLNAEIYYGRREHHNLRILGTESPAPLASLAIVECASVNEPETARRVRESGADIHFVFGTGIVRPPVFAGAAAPFVNMHWGWSPDYRGEGIVSALATQGPGALGVTVHLLDPGIDSGAILYRARCETDAEDNFYSIGLKLAKLGTALFLQAAQELREKGRLEGTPQERGRGRLYSARYMREHPELYARAWAALHP